MMSQKRIWIAVVVASLCIAPIGAKAAPDVDGAVDALIATPYNVIGDWGASFGLVSASVGGALGDVLALVDDNEYSRVLLRGIFSKMTYRLSQTVSYTFTGMLEGARSENFAAFPESDQMYGGDTGGVEARMRTLTKGLGAAVLGLADGAVGIPLAIMRGFGEERTARKLSSWQREMRDKLVGTVR